MSLDQSRVICEYSSNHPVPVRRQAHGEVRVRVHEKGEEYLRREGWAKAEHRPSSYVRARLQLKLTMDLPVWQTSEAAELLVAAICHATTPTRRMVVLLFSFQYEMSGG